MTSRGRTEQCRDRLIGSYQDRLLFEYVFEAPLARELAPRPYFHPVRTLGGVTLTDHQPTDHRWHLGLAYSWPVVDEWNLWGGPTFMRDRGYVDLDNRGQIRHLSWIGHHEQLEWLDRAWQPDCDRTPANRRARGGCCCRRLVAGAGQRHREHMRARAADRVAHHRRAPAGRLCRPCLEGTHGASRGTRPP